MSSDNDLAEDRAVIAAAPVGSWNLLAEAHELTARDKYISRARERWPLAIERGDRLQAKLAAVAELYDGRPEGFRDHLKQRATELVPDYPWTDNQPWEWLWAITSSLEGTRLANDDCHKEIERLKAENERLHTLLAQAQDVLRTKHHASQCYVRDGQGTPQQTRSGLFIYDCKCGLDAALRNTSGSVSKGEAKEGGRR